MLPMRRRIHSVEETCRTEKKCTGAHRAISPGLRSAASQPCAEVWVRIGDSVVGRAGDKHRVDRAGVIENRAIRDQRHPSCLDRSPGTTRYQPDLVERRAGRMTICFQKDIQRPRYVERLRLRWHDDSNGFPRGRRNHLLISSAAARKHTCVHATGDQ